MRPAVARIVQQVDSHTDSPAPVAFVDVRELLAAVIGRWRLLAAGVEPGLRADERVVAAVLEAGVDERLPEGIAVRGRRPALRDRVTDEGDVAEAGVRLRGMRPRRHDRREEDDDSENPLDATHQAGFSA